jgi:hypothetical protein
MSTMYISDFRKTSCQCHFFGHFPLYKVLFQKRRILIRIFGYYSSPPPSYNASHTKGHPSYQAMFQMDSDTQILLKCPSYKAIFFIAKGGGHIRGWNTVFESL